MFSNELSVAWDKCGHFVGNFYEDFNGDFNGGEYKIIVLRSSFAW